MDLYCERPSLAGCDGGPVGSDDGCAVTWLCQYLSEPAYHLETVEVGPARRVCGKWSGWCRLLDGRVRIGARERGYATL